MCALIKAKLRFIPVEISHSATLFFVRCTVCALIKAKLRFIPVEISHF